MTGNRIFLNGNKSYLVIQRGMPMKNIFLKSADYSYYLRVLKKYKSMFNIHVFAFCLLPDSAYMILQPKEVGALPVFLRAVNQSYNLYSNARYQKTGDAWESGYKSRVIKDDADLLNFIEYIEFLPVKFELSLSELEYPWSSCSHRVLGENGGILDRNVILE